MDEKKEDISASKVGLRYNEGKIPLDQIPPEFLFELGKVFEYGQKKYAKNNWLKGMPWMVCVGCALRHIYKWTLGEKYDDESGCHHLAHAAWNCMAPFIYELHGLGEDDRPPSTIQKIKEFIKE